MAKRLFLLLLASFIGVIINPTFLMADTAKILKEPDFNAVNTVEIKKEEPTPEVNTLQLAIARTVSYSAPAASKPVYVAPSNAISIAGRTLEIVQVPDTTYDSGSHVNKYGDKFLYGHNSGAVFGGLVSVGVGQTFSVTINDVTTNYRVTERIIYEKNITNGRLQLNGQGNYMAAVANARNKDTGATYSLSIMTCYGTSYGNGDASHRLVLFASAL